MTGNTRPFAVVTGASSGIGFELARCCVAHGYDLLIAADEPAIEDAASKLRSAGANVEALQVDLATLQGVDQLVEALRGRRVAALLANAGRGLGRAFLDQDFEDVRRVVDTNVTGTLYLIQKIEREMPAREVAKIGFDAMLRGDADVVAGWQNKLQAAISHVLPSGVLAELHRGMAAPGSAAKS